MQSASLQKSRLLWLISNEQCVIVNSHTPYDKVIPRLSIIQNLDMHRIVVVLPQNIAYSIIANQKLFIVIMQIS